ncbi:MAG: hypothetical protein H6926_09395 [Chromatiales bacterium]|nr:hypothetical protein [Chromatiales bacterium]
MNTKISKAKYGAPQIAIGRDAIRNQRRPISIDFQGAHMNSKHGTAIPVPIVGLLRNQLLLVVR